MSRIDAHHHLWDLNEMEYPWLMAKGVKRFFGDPAPIQRDFLLDELQDLARPLGFGASVHIQVGAKDGMAEARFIDRIASEAKDWPLVQVAAVDLCRPDIEDALDELTALTSVRGVRQIIGRAPKEDAATGTHGLLDDPAFRNGLACLAGRKLSFDLQLIPEVMDKTARLLADLPELSVVLCHAGSPHDRSEAGLAYWASELKKLSALPQLQVKLSGLGMFELDWTPESLAPIIDTVWQQFGQQRIMFGSNFPVDSLSSIYEKLVRFYEDKLQETAFDSVFYANANGFYRL